MATQQQLDKKLALGQVSAFLGAIASAALYIKDEKTLYAFMMGVFGLCLVTTVTKQVADSFKQNRY